jgi:hypothetical protein
MNSKNYEELTYYVLDHFTKGGTPLPALIGNKLEWQVTTLVAGLLANEHVSSSLDATDIVDAALWEMRNGTVHGLMTDVKSVYVLGE